MRPITVTIILIAIISCGGVREEESGTTDNSSVDSALEVCREWVEYLESSDDGL